MSANDQNLESPIRPACLPEAVSIEHKSTQAIIAKLELQEHPEGGYFVETDRDHRRVPNPFQPHENDTALQQPVKGEEDDITRAASTTIYYLLTPKTPTGFFHRNKGRTIHTLHKGRGRYVIIHADKAKPGQKARIETFVVGHNVHAGERLQWLVEGGKYKASFLLPDKEGAGVSEGLLISEVREGLSLLVPSAMLSNHAPRRSCPASNSAIMTFCRRMGSEIWSMQSSTRSFAGCYRPAAECC